MRVLWTGDLSARHDFWPRPLSVDTHPTVTTCKANNWKDASVPQIHRTLRQVRRWSVGHDAASQPALWQVRPAVARDGSGAYAIRALPDLCVGILSERLERLSSPLGFLLGYWKPRHVRGFFCCRTVVPSCVCNVSASRPGAAPA
jgi:hypothetical protein